MPDTRQEKLAKIESNGSFDVIVVGGGINGIGTFHDLAHQGLRVLLVEMNDFCSGCSAALSRMIHGGLRYLENGEIALVRESLAERDRTFRPPTGRGDEFVHGAPGTPDPRGKPAASVRSKDIFEPDRHIDTLKIKSRNFQ